MRLVSPALHYIKYLACHTAGYTTSTIRARLIRERLDFISDDYIDSVRADMELPVPFYPKDARHLPSFSFIHSEKINRLFHPDDAMRTARGILALPRAKEFVEAMLLVHIPMSAIAAYVTEHRGVRCNAEAIQVYRHYFWNIDLLDASEMRALVALRFDQIEEREPALKGRKNLATSAYYKDSRKVAADLPYSPTTALLAQMRLGIRPSRIDLALRLMDARDMSIVRAIEAVQQDGPRDSEKFLNYVNGGRILEELLQLVAKPEDHMQEQLRAIALRTETRTLPSVHQLSAGRHTVEMAPLEDPHDGAVEGEVVVREGDEHGNGGPAG